MNPEVHEVLQSVLQSMEEDVEAIESAISSGILAHSPYLPLFLSVYAKLSIGASEIRRTNLFRREGDN